MNRTAGLSSFVLVLATLSVPSYAGGQDVAVFADQQQRTPRFLYAANKTARSVEIDPRSAPLLRTRISVTFDDVPLRDALDIISRESGLRLFYSKDVVELDTRVRLRAEDITVAAALTEVLLDSSVDVLLGPNGKAALVKRTAAALPAAQEVGTITGRVTNAETGEPVVNAQVVVEGTGRGTSADADGRFRIGEVPVGWHTVAVSSIGFARSTQEVEVAEGATVTVDFTLEVSPTTLNELVVTATGQRRRVELGHVVGRINADSIARVAPVSSLSELLTGRVPGLQVFTHSGQVGGNVSLQARTPNSINLGSEPIIFVDGVRYENATGFGQTRGMFLVEETSRLNDLNPNDIESIEVVKGPSAATLYGTDAANGVLLITTKRGQAGEARWNAYARSALSEIPRQQYPTTYWGWGTVNGTPDSPRSCTLALLASSQCTQQDSIVALPSAFNDPELTVFHSKPSWEYGASVSGGSQDMRYHFSANLSQATGPIQMPTAALERLLAERGVDALPDEQFEPNAQRQMTLRGNVTLDLGPTAELQFNSGYGHTSVRTSQSSYSGSRAARPGFPYGRTGDPADLFSETSTEGTDRVFGSVLGQWRPQTWLQGRATLGVDLGNSERYSLLRPEHVRPGACCGPPGQVQEVRTRRLAITADVGLSAHARVGRLSFRTAVGSQYTRQKTNQLASGGFGLPPGGESVGQVESKFVSQDYGETATLGSYVEETIGLNNRLFVSGALRVDGASNFGRDYKAAVYPKASVSWLVSEEPFMPRVPGLDELRFRYAFGASGQQPTSFMTLPRFSILDALVDSVPTTAIAPGNVGNPELRPERVREHEAGLDVTGLAGRFQFGLTWFDRTVTDQLVLRPASVGFGSVFRNLGRLSAHGFEADLTVRPIETRHVTWQITLQHTSLSTRVEDLGDLTEIRGTVGGFVEGYPLGGRFSTEILGWDDANGDGILGPAELQMSTEATFQGESTPPRTQTLSTSVGLFGQRVRLSALLQRLSGYTQINGLSCPTRACRAAVDPSTPLEEQAVVVAPSAARPYANIEPADHTRLQEVTLAADLPEALLRGVKLRTGTVTLSGRNLALWTSFSGPDPASASVFRYAGDTARNIPQSRTWVVRLDLGW